MHEHFVLLFLSSSHFYCYPKFTTRFLELLHFYGIDQINALIVFVFKFNIIRITLEMIEILKNGGYTNSIQIVGAQRLGNILFLSKNSKMYII